ncbi:hypothetical protein [Spirosoma jeollabukense]
MSTGASLTDSRLTFKDVYFVTREPINEFKKPTLSSRAVYHTTPTTTLLFSLFASPNDRKG